MKLEEKEYLFIAAALAAVAGALSAIAFAFFQASCANREQLKENLLAAQAEFTRRVRALNEHLRMHGSGEISFDTNAASEEFDASFSAALKDAVAKINKGLVVTFERFAGTSMDNLARYLFDAAGDDRLAVEQLMLFVQGQFRNDTANILERIKTLKISIRQSERQSGDLIALAALSGVSVLMLCAAAVPPIGWELLHFVLYIGVTLIFVFYVKLFLTAYADMVALSEQTEKGSVSFYEFVACLLMTGLAYVVFLTRSLW
jgi:hypothetical protein